MAAGGTEGRLRERIEAYFGSLEAFRAESTKAAAIVEGSVWALLFDNPRRSTARQPS